MEWRGEVPSSPRSFGTAPEPPQLAGPPLLCVFFAGLECPFFVLLRLTHAAAAAAKFKMAPQLLRPIPASRAPGRPAKSVVRSTSGRGSVAPPATSRLGSGRQPHQARARAGP
ncbi:hypothetical protein NDU88_009454 [Pleurodeles waltl]|uniref:Uncharacterized protein n=1 Tax=Pleurodeles waltl TaxID=8319 RepID=A0AAV7PUR1_PLEWA|nr:hypothetical protein NDU88_009454 [Pleurodeles waltl]